MSDVRVPSYSYACRLVRVVDGDTLVVEVDLGFEVWRRITVRLWGINCPEAKGPTREAGIEATEATATWFSEHKDLVLVSHKLDVAVQADSFRRYLAVIYGDYTGELCNGKQECLNQYLLTDGFAVPFMES